MRRVEPVDAVDPADGANIGATLNLLVELLHQVLARLAAPPVRALTVPDAARALSVSPATAWEMIATGELASVTVHQRSRRVPMEAIDAYLAVQLAREGHGGVASLLAVPVEITPPVARPVQRPSRERVAAPRKGRKAS